MKGDAVTGFLKRAVQTAASFGKVMLLSRRPFEKGKEKQRAALVMGNGPSLRQTIDTMGDRMGEYDLMAVNFFANTPDFRVLRPQMYILADGHFFRGTDSDPNVPRLWENITGCDWDMTLYVPWKYAREAWQLAGKSPRVKLEAYNLTPAEGWDWATHRLYSAGMATPRPRNVMVPAIMTAIRAGYRRIFLAGADHTWTRTLGVDDENFVVSVQPHFYADNEEEHRRVRKAYAGLKLHDVLGSMTVAFKSYWQIKDYADSAGVSVVNATPRSMIDAFPRVTL